MTRFSADEFESTPVRYDWVIPSDGNALVIPDAHLLFTGTFRKVGPDLIIEGDGKSALLPDYFSHQPAALHSVEGARLDAETIRALSGLDSPWVFAQAGGASGPPEIGTVRKLEGTASVVRGNATQNLASGDPVYQGDVVQTGAASTLGIILKDNTVFSLSSDARMVMNQLVYDASRTDNSMSMSLVQGSFVFITGQVAKTGSVSVSTPVATMGIRGTTPIVKLSTLDGSGEFSLSADPDRAVGNYILYDATGNEVARVGSTDITVRIQSAAGPFQTFTKSLADTAADNALVAPAFETYLLITQRGDIPSLRPETGKGQGSESFQYALKVTNITLLGETQLLDDGLIGTLQYLGNSRLGGGNDILQSPNAPLSVDLDTSSPGLNRFVNFPENSGPLPVTSSAQISVPNGATAITGATVTLVNALAGDNMLVGVLPQGITATITFGSIHVNLTGTASVADYTAAIQSIQFINNSDDPPADIREITVTVVASNGETATATTFVTIDQINDAPNHIVPTGQSTGEDGPLVYSQENGNAITVNDPDAGTHAITTTLTVEHGTLTAGTLVDGVAITGSESGTLVLIGPQGLINQALDGLTYQPNAGFNGSDAVVISTNDNNTDGSQGSGGPLSTTTTGSEITVTSVNDAPSGADTTISTDEDTPVVLSIASFGFSDAHDSPPNALLAVKITTLPDGGSLSLDGNAVSIGQFVSAADIEAGKLVLTPAPDSTATASFTFQVQDDGGSGSEGADLDLTARTLSILVAAVNDAPVAVDDGSYTVGEDYTLRVYAAGGVLANDGDIDSTALTASLVEGPQHGSLTLNPDGSFTYAPNDDYNGTDSFTYRASDGSLNSNAATVSLVVAAVNDAPVALDDGSYTVGEDYTLRVYAAGGVLANDTDVDSTALTASLIEGPQHGSLTLNPNGSFTYTPDVNYNGTDSFTYRASDGSLNSNTATVSLVVAAVNDAPIVSGPTASLPTTEYAVESLNPNFTPYESSPGVYQLTGESQGQAAAVWHAVDLSQSWAWSTQVQLSSSCAPSGADGITFTLQTQGIDALTQLNADGNDHTGGSLAVGGFGSSGLPDAFGIWIDTWDNGQTIEASGNSISFYANDSAGQTDVPEGATPSELYSNLENGLWNDLKITWDAATGTLSYQLSLAKTGETFAASQHFDGVTAGQTYYFGFTASTGAAFNEQAVKVLSVEAPHAVEQVPLSIRASGFVIADVDAGLGLLSATLQLGDAAQGRLNASEGDSGVTIVSGNGTGELVLSGTLEQLNTFLGHGGTGTLTFTATQDDPASNVSLTLTVNDNGNTGSGGAQTGSAAWTIVIDAVNDAPVAYGDGIYTTDAVDTLNVSSAYGVLANDHDVDSNLLTATLVDGPQHGTVWLNDNGSFSYQPYSRYYIGADSFTYTASDGQSVSNTATVSLAISRSVDEDYHDGPYHYPTVLHVSVVQTDSQNEGSAFYVDNVTITPSLTTAAGTQLVQPVQFDVGYEGDIALDVRQFYYLQTAVGGENAGTPDALTLTVSYDLIDHYGSTTHGTATINIAGRNEGETFTGVGSAVEMIDFSSANFQNTTTVAFEADAYLRNPNYAVDVLTNFDNTEHRIDLSSIFDELEPNCVNASNIQNFVNATFDGTKVVVGASAISGAPFNVASIAGTAGSDHHTIAAGDTIAIVFDHVNAANVTVQGMHG